MYLEKAGNALESCLLWMYTLRGFLGGLWFRRKKELNALAGVVGGVYPLMSHVFLLADVIAVGLQVWRTQNSSVALNTSVQNVKVSSPGKAHMCKKKNFFFKWYCKIYLLQEWPRLDLQNWASEHTKFDYFDNWFKWKDGCVQNLLWCAIKLYIILLTFKNDVQYDLV